MDIIFDSTHYMLSVSLVLRHLMPMKIHDSTV